MRVCTKILFDAKNLPFNSETLSELKALNLNQIGCLNADATIIIDDEEKVNTKEQDEKIKAEAKKVDGTVENVEKRNYDYSPKIDNINNVNAQEMMNGVYYECKNDPSLSLEEQEFVIEKVLLFLKEAKFKANEIFKASDLMVDSLTQLIARKRSKKIN